MKNKRFSWSYGVIILASLSLAACAQTRSLTSPQYAEAMGPGLSILLFEPDVEISSLGVSGIAEPNAQWTEQAQTHVIAALKAEMEERQTSLVVNDKKSLTAAERQRQRQIKRLYENVGAAIMLRQFVPTASKKKDWTLGDGVHDINAQSDHDFALFVFFRDQHATAGRVAAQVGLSLIGVHMQGPVQIGHAALVDLKTGDVAWFNQLFSAAGDLREGSSARSAVEDLLSKMPI